MQRNTPILINVPHSATYIPTDELKYFTTPNLQHELDVMTDHYCDDLYDTGDRMIRFPISRLVCDPERFRDDAQEIMSTVGMGAIYRSCSDRSELKKVTDDHREELLRRYYDWYHNGFEMAVEECLDIYDKCLIIDGHSFPAVPLPYELDQDRNRPDICIGTDENHTPREFESAIVDFFRSRGYTVELNRPFAGTIVPMRYYREDQRVMSVMIEANRRLYMNEDLTKSSAYDRLKQDIAELIGTVLSDKISTDFFR